jgi:hypothetical protein
MRISSGGNLDALHTRGWVSKYMQASRATIPMALRLWWAQLVMCSWVSQRQQQQQQMQMQRAEDVGVRYTFISAMIYVHNKRL